MAVTFKCPACGGLLSSKLGYRYGAPQMYYLCTRCGWNSYTGKSYASDHTKPVQAPRKDTRHERL